MKMSSLFISILLFFTGLFSAQIENPYKIAVNFAARHDLKISVTDQFSVINSDGNALAYAYDCLPEGFVVVSADDKLIPVIAYSDRNSFDADSPLASMIRADLNLRQTNYDKMDQTVKIEIEQKWKSLLSPDTSKPKFEQWPPEGSTTTGGWTETRWNQGAPYNKFCPMDLGSGGRSLTGCPSTAMSQLLNFHKKINGTKLNNRKDRYYHNYTQDFWIDDASETYDFLTFTELNVYLDSIEVKWAEGRELTEDEIAALNWACGITTKSVFSSSGSGTFGVDQAYDAYVRFGFTSSILLNSTYSDKDIKIKMSENIKIGSPVHLATVDPSWSTGHNVVCDGYNSDDYFRLNFGWGGSADGWYSLPEGFPYSLTVFEGIVADINLPTGIEDPALPITTELYQNYPNPFNPVTEIKLSLAEDTNVNLSVFNTKGELVADLINEKMLKGIHAVNFNAAALNSGLYFYKLNANGKIETKKMMLLK